MPAKTAEIDDAFWEALGGEGDIEPEPEPEAEAEVSVKAEPEAEPVPEAEVSVKVEVEAAPLAVPASQTRARDGASGVWSYTSFVLAP